MIKILIKYGARFDIQDNQGQTCLHIACQSLITDTIFEFIINNSPDSCLNIENQFGCTLLDLIYLSSYEQATLSRMHRLHLLLSRQKCKLTRYGMREPNLLIKKQYKLFDILSCKEFLFKYRLKDIFHSSIRLLSWYIFLFYDVLRACEQQYMNSRQEFIQQRLESYLISMIENGEISLNKLIYRLNDNDQDIILTNTQIKCKLIELRMKTLSLKSICRIKIKNDIQIYPNDIIKLNSISKILRVYLTYYNPFIKANLID